MNDKPTHDDLMEWIRRRSDARKGPDGEIIEPTLNTREDVYKELIASVAEFNVRIAEYNRRLGALEPNSEEAIKMTPEYLGRIRKLEDWAKVLEKTIAGMRESLETPSTTG